MFDQYVNIITPSALPPSSTQVPSPKTLIVHLFHLVTLCIHIGSFYSGKTPIIIESF